MSQKIRMMAAFAAVMGLVAYAEAQPRPGEGRPGGGRGPGGFGGGGGGVVSLITNTEVQSDIKLTDEQKDKLAAWYEKHQDKVEEKTKGLGREREDFRKRFEIMAELNKEAEKEIEGVLKPEQLKRVKQISLQMQGSRALTTEQVQKDLGITEEQKEKFQKIGEESREAFRSTFQQGRPDFEKMQAMQKEIGEKYQGVLTSEQKTKWKEMTGEPFDTSKLRPQFGGGQPRRRNNDNNNNDN